ncbi:MAG: hypothetical protein D6681_10440 [Calditrichaeota bacterium]|nr:MAG: hypothetical protein D6681_10440 [Calditrichota bacterium]
MIAEFFKDLTEIPGIEAVILFDNQNNVIDSWAVSKYNPTMFPDIGQTFLHTFGVMEHLNYDLNEIAMPHDRGILYARCHPKFYLVVISRLSVELSLIRLAVDVCLAEFLENRKVKKTLKKMSARKFFQIKTATLDDVERIMLENILEESNAG